LSITATSGSDWAAAAATGGSHSVAASSQPNGLSGSCDGGTISAPDFTSTVSIVGASLPAGGSCTFGVNVVALSTGSKDNTTSAASSNEAGSGAAATASLSVAGTVPTLSSWGLLLMIAALGGFGARAVRRRLRV
jgi:IPTL-CTERM motif